MILDVIDMGQEIGKAKLYVEKPCRIITKAKKLLNYDPSHFIRDGLIATVAWHLEN